MRKLHKKVADQWLRKQAAPAMLRVVMQELEKLQELSDNLTEIEDQVSQTFRMAKTIDPEVKSQFDALKKAREGLKQARATGTAVAEILKHYPEDKTALRAAKDAVVMIKRFEKHEADASKVIARLSKKALPPALKKMAAAAARMIKSRLLDPKLLTMDVWQEVDYNYHTDRKGVKYLVLLRVPTKGGLAGVGLQESTVRTGVFGVFGVSEGKYQAHLSSASAKPVTAKGILAAFLDNKAVELLLKGGDAKANNRATVAADLFSEIWGEWRSLYSGDGPSRDMASNGLSMEFEARPLPRQDHGGGDDGDDWMDGSEVSRLTREEDQRTERAVGGILKKYKPYLKNYSTDYGEKGHWTLYIYLK